MRGKWLRASAFLFSASVPAIMLASGAAAQQSVPMIQIIDPITLLATKTEEKAIDTLAAVSTIRQDQIDRRMATRTSDLFMGMPGVWFQERADDPGTSIVIRGLQDFGRVAVNIDGARQNFQRTGHNSNGIFYIDPEMIGGIDVIRGPVANIYGSGAIGGVASFRTKDVEDVLKPGQRWGILTHGMATDNSGQLLGSAFTAARVNPNVDFVFGGSLRDRQVQKDARGVDIPNSANDTQSGLAKLTVRPADGHEVKFSALGYGAQFFNGTPNTTRTSTVYDASVLNYVTTLGWKYQKPEDKLFDFDGKVYWTSTMTDLTKVQGTNNAASGRLFATRSFTVDTTGFDVNNTSRFDTGPFHHAVTYGGDAFRDAVTVTDPTGTGDLFTPNGDRTVSGAFVQWKANYSTWLEAISAVRYDSYTLNGGNFSSDGDRFSPKFTLGVTPLPFITFYGTYAEGYRAPALSEALVTGQHPFLGPGSNFTFLPNTALRAEVGKTKELGVNIKQDNLFTQGDALRIKANIFRNDVDNFIDQTFVAFGTTAPGGVICTTPPPTPFPPFGGGECLQYQNVAQARLEGVEFEGTYDAGVAFFGLSASHITGENVQTGAPLLKIMPDQVTGTVGVRLFDRKVTTSVSIQGVDGKDAADIPRSTSAPFGPVIPPTSAYTLINYYLAYTPHEDLTLMFGIDNLTNEYYARYLDVTTSATNSVISVNSPGRTYKIGAKIRFGDDFGKSGKS